jgi:hypothetical protein
MRNTCGRRPRLERVLQLEKRCVLVAGASKTLAGSRHVVYSANAARRREGARAGAGGATRRNVIQGRVSKRCTL